jgi:hypothetical protein
LQSLLGFSLLNRTTQKKQEAVIKQFQLFKFSSNFNAVFWKVHVHLYELLMGHINYFSILFKKLQNVA